MPNYSYPSKNESEPPKSAVNEAPLTAIERAMTQALITVLLKEIRSSGSHSVSKLVA
jgi:hypothetical protein